MFNISNFLMKTLEGMIGNYPDFQVREYALNWYAKGKLTEDDLAAIDATIEAQYIVPAPPVEEETEIEDETILDETEETEEPTEIVEDSNNDEVIDDPLEETPADDETE